MEVGMYANDTSCKSHSEMKKPECGSKNSTQCVEDFKNQSCSNTTTPEFQERCAPTLTFCYVRVNRECRSFWHVEASKKDDETMVPRRHRVGDVLNPNHPHTMVNKTHWSYDKPQNWAKTYPLCGGEKQSPVNIDRAKLTYWGNESVWEKVHHVALPNRSLTNTGHGLQVNGHFGKLTINGTDYQMRQFNMHFPSEHKVDGKSFAGELQFSHQAVGAKGTEKLLMFSVFFIDGDDNEFLDTLGFKEKLPVPGLNVSIVGEIDPYEAFADQIDNQFYRYEGSLTTPPCTEGVKWFVFEEPAEVSKRQVRMFKKLFPNPRNNRPSQWLNDRMVEKNVLELVRPPKELGIKDSQIVPWYFWLIAGTIVLVVSAVVVVGCYRVNS
jgi:carbonic anhydrase